MSMVRRIVIPMTVLLVALVLLPATAGASSSVSSGVLTITGDPTDDNIDVSCVGGSVKVNNADPDSGAVACSSITSIVANLGTGNDMLSLSGATALLGYTSLTGSTLNGDIGNDTLIGTEMPDSVNGGDGNDTLYITKGNDTLDGGLGTDTVTGGDGNFVLTDSSFSGDTMGTDILVSIEAATCGGLNGDDTLDATGFSGPTELYGNGGSDTILGGPNKDTIDSGSGGGIDVLNGNGGNDWLFPQTGDTANGGDGKDRMEPFTSGDVTLVPGSLTDANGTVTFTGIETVAFDFFGAVNAATFDGKLDIAGDTSEQTVVGGLNADRIQGGGGNDTLKGMLGNDTLLGQAGDDVLVGGKGTDACKGGPGANTLKSCE